MDQTKRTKLPQEHNQDAPCAWNRAGNPTARAEPGDGAPGQLLSKDFRTTRPPYEPHVAQNLASLQEINDSVPRRAVKLDSLRCAGAVDKRLPSSPDGRKCWQRHFGARVAPARVVQQSLANAQESKYRQRPVAASQKEYARSSEPCV